MNGRILALVLLAALPCAATAQTSGLNVCADEASPADQRIVACKAALQGNLSAPQREDVQTSLGAAYQAARDYNDAQQLYTQILQSDPAAWRVYLQRGRLFEAIGQNDAAFADYGTAIKLHPSAETYQSRALAYGFSGKTDLSIADLNQGLAIEPDDALSLIYRAEDYNDLGQHDKAIADNAQALKLDAAKHELTPFARGVAEAQAGTLDAALSDLNTAIQQSPRDGRIWFNRGAIYAGQAKYQLALSDLNKSIELIPTFSRALRVRSGVYVSLKDYPPALADLGTAIALGPPDSRMFGLRANIYLQIYKYDEAIADDDAALKLSPDNRLALSDRCWARAAVNKEINLAMADCNHALALDPNDAPLLDSVAFVHFRQNDLQAAMDGYTRVLAISPKEASSLYMRGIVEKRLGKTEDSERDIAAANAIDPAIAKFYADMGVMP